MVTMGALTAHPYAQQHVLVQCPTASPAHQAGETPDFNFFQVMAILCL